jgi:hypothetical protein
VLSFSDIPQIELSLWPPAVPQVVEVSWGSARRTDRVEVSGRPKAISTTTPLGRICAFRDLGVKRGRAFLCVLKNIKTVEKREDS